MTERVIGVVICAKRFSSASTVLMTSNCWRAQDGQEITVTPWRLRPSDLRMSKPTLISSTGSAASETRSGSPRAAEDHVRRVAGNLEFEKVVVLENLGVGQGALDHRLGAGLAIALEQIALE